ncbi:pitrilysin family protein [Roseobacter sp. HKCCA0434]|uniref:M16 family metallopeptidase n=1 Tax=Roseobacter sp. HKCCA0434 TaxID=3079297 RepID=UPI002905D106|nr:pitrilysin family protein [Roseobacter sp. HKCCA0434]
MIRTLICAATLTLAAPALAQTEIEEVVTPGGVTFWLSSEPSIPIVSMEFVFRGGARLDPDGLPGTVTMMSGLLNEGAGELDALEYAQEVESLAARFGFDASRDLFTVSASMLRENRVEAVELLRLALQEPRFDEDAVARVRAQMASVVRSNQTDAGTLASQTLFKIAYPDHPYATPVDGTPESVAAITVGDLRAAREDVLVRDRAFVSVVGDVSAEEASELVDIVMEGLPQSGPDLPGDVDVALSGGVAVVPLPGGQSQALFGHAGIARDDPDFMAAFVLNHILGGGGFTSRLTEEVRVKRGLTYGIGSFLSTPDHGPLMLGSVASANGTVAEALDVVRAEWARMLEDGVTQEELDDAKRFLTGAYPLRFDTNAKIANILVGVQEAELGIDYTQRRNALIEAVTVEDVNRMAERLLQPEALTVVVVGEPEGLEPTLSVPE